jgi:hypothetical protein
VTIVAHSMNQVSGQGTDLAPEKPSLKSRALEEARKAATITIYLWFLFALFGLYRRAILQQHGISAWNQGFAIINALVFAKVILVGQALNGGGRLRKGALVWVVLGKSLIFAILLILFHITEGGIKALIKGLPLSTSIADFGGGTAFGVAVFRRSSSWRSRRSSRFRKSHGSLGPACYGTSSSTPARRGSGSWPRNRDRRGYRRQAPPAFPSRHRFRSGLLAALCRRRCHFPIRISKRVPLRELLGRDLAAGRDRGEGRR